MKVLLILALMPISTFAGDCETLKSASVSHKKVDETKYCYYESKEYSLGSRLKQLEQVMTCVKSKANDQLIWSKI
ncbi:DUF1496 domain-containing protein [Shewanella indica]|uniref:DUF1496 domain-containing protein n=1 Tax=Shewanella indica TaxID=768528 RepID=UPI003999BED7